MVTKKSLAEEVPPPISNVAHYALIQGLEVLDNVSVGEISRRDEFERVKKERDHFLEEKNAYKMEKEKLGEDAVRMEVVVKAMTRSLVDLERSVIRLKMERRLARKTNENLLSCSSQTTSSGGRVTNKSLKNIPPIYLGFEFNVERAILKYCSKEVSEILSFILELEKTGSGKVKKWRKWE